MATASPSAALLEDRYQIADPDRVETPAVAVFPHLIRRNIQQSLQVLADGDTGHPANRPADRMRPHVKTHKTVELIRLELDEGITKHKCATIAEAELLIEAGVKDIVLAYPMVGPNIGRYVELCRRHPGASVKPLVDHGGPLAALGKAMAGQPRPAEVLLDLDVGQGRTGIAPGPQAEALYRQISHTPGVVPGGLHVYDGHNHQRDAQERAAAVGQIWDTVRAFVARLEAGGSNVPRLVCGGSPTFPAWARIAAHDERIECSPGTFFLNDWGYFQAYADIPLEPAAVLLTRIISKPRPNRITLDAGTKAVASDPPLERRVRLLGIPDARILWQNEEHLIVETSQADQLEPGDLLYAWPGHICPTCALHRELLVIEAGRVVGTWPVRGRDRKLGC